jgi:type IV pilus assembly protein PilA
MSKTTKTVLIVCGVLFVVGIPVLLIFLALAIPALQKVTIRANETSAILSLRTLNRAETQYSVVYPQRGFSCSEAALGGDPASGPPTPEAAHLIPADLAYGDKAGYTFFILCPEKALDNHEKNVDYKIIALPKVIGHSGLRGFCTDESGDIKFDPKGGTNCTEVLQ